MCVGHGQTLENLHCKVRPFPPDDESTQISNSKKRGSRRISCHTLDNFHLEKRPSSTLWPQWSSLYNHESLPSFREHHITPPLMDTAHIAWIIVHSWVSKDMNWIITKFRNRYKIKCLMFVFKCLHIISCTEFLSNSKHLVISETNPASSVQIHNRSVWN